MPKVPRFYNISVSTTVLQIVPYNAMRTGITIKNYSGSTVFISADQVDLTAKGYPLAAGDWMTFLKTEGDIPQSQIYAVVASGSADLRIVESYGEI